MTPSAGGRVHVAESLSFSNSPAGKFEWLSGRVKVTEAGCWEWQGSRNHGYGEVRIGGVKYKTHRRVLEMKLGRKLEPGEQTRHRCDNPPCCNPGHLEPGTVRDNVRDMIKRGRAKMGLGGRPTTLTVEFVEEVRRRWAAGETQKSIAESLGVSRARVFRAARGGPQPAVVQHGWRPPTLNRNPYTPYAALALDTCYGANPHQKPV